MSNNTVMVALNDVNDRIYTTKNGKRVLIKCGTSHLRGKKNAVIPKGAYGLTAVDAADWEEIKKIYGNTKVFKTGLIFAAADPSLAEAEAAEKSGTRHGLEPADTTKTETQPDKKGSGKKGKAVEA